MSDHSPMSDCPPRVSSQGRHGCRMRWGEIQKLCYVRAIQAVVQVRKAPVITVPRFSERRLKFFSLSI